MVDVQVQHVGFGAEFGLAGVKGIELRVVKVDAEVIVVADRNGVVLVVLKHAKLTCDSSSSHTMTPFEVAGTPNKRHCI